ncbi:MAG: MBL fold metallo-hydrolase [Erysipelotrichaceae bacterium]|nr:MBL fold metallo-hydrolase [Erysipelotrichaceae bacterium]
MKTKGIRIRYVNYACYEIVLPNGKVIVVDPSIDYTNKTTEFTRDDFTGADYILLSHTHYDHDSDLPYLAEKFDSKVFVGAMSCYGELQYSDIPFDNIYPVYPGEVYEMQDFTLEVFRGKHTFLGKQNRMSLIEPKESLNDYFPKNHKQSDIFGGIEYMDYMITTKENTRIFINGGGPNWMFYNNIFTTMKEKSPNIVFRQSSSKYTPEVFAQTVDQFHAQLVFPLHQDGVARKTDFTIKEYVERANAEFDRIGSNTRMINPVPFKWYTISFCVEEED